MANSIIVACATRSTRLLSGSRDSRRLQRTDLFLYIILFLNTTIPILENIIINLFNKYFVYNVKCLMDCLGPLYLKLFLISVPTYYFFLYSNRKISNKHFLFPHAFYIIGWIYPNNPKADFVSLICLYICMIYSNQL